MAAEIAGPVGALGAAGVGGPASSTASCNPPGGRTCQATDLHQHEADIVVWQLIPIYVFGGYNPGYDESGGPDNEDYPLFREL